MGKKLSLPIGTKTVVISQGRTPLGTTGGHEGYRQMMHPLTGGTNDGDHSPPKPVRSVIGTHDLGRCIPASGVNIVTSQCESCTAQTGTVTNVPNRTSCTHLHCSETATNLPTYIPLSDQAEKSSEYGD